MSETSSNEQASQPQFAIQRIYIKDLSFEAPNVPGMFTEQWEGNTNLEINTSTTRLSEEGIYEVVLSLTVTTKVGEKTAYLVEVQQAGIFTVAGFNEQDLGGMLGSYCPNVLFPYAREVISDLVAKGSFPQLILSPVNFDALYAQHLAQQQASAEEEAPVH